MTITLQRVQGHTGLTRHLKKILTFGHCAENWAPECPNVKKFKTADHRSATICHHWAWKG